MAKLLKENLAKKGTKKYPSNHKKGKKSKR